MRHGKVRMNNFRGWKDNTYLIQFFIRNKLLNLKIRYICLSKNKKHYSARWKRDPKTSLKTH